MNITQRMKDLKGILLFIGLALAATSPAGAQSTAHATGVDGTTVYLNDLEDHSWSYYSDADCPIRSLNPADVTITYYGNGTGTISTTNGATPGNASWTQNATGVQLSYNETANTFVYYKTLERTDGSTSANPTGRCAYTTIPNPFSKRPTYGTGDNRWRGFYAWRVRSVNGGTIHTAATGGTQINAGGTINAETEVYFAPSAETGMTVELEALWARAYVVTSNTNGANNIGSYSVGYERNFIVLTTANGYRYGGNNNRRISNTGYDVTISNYYPDGTVGNAGASMSNNGITLGANVKFENTTFNLTSNTLTAANHNLIIGRGCTGTVNIVRGMGGNSTSALNYTIRLESGVFNYVSFTAGYYTNADGNQGSAYTFSGSNNKVRGVLGCDYERAVESSNSSYNYANAPLRVTYNMIVGATPSFSNQTETEFFNTTIKSGYYGSAFTGLGSGSAANSFYLGVANTFNTGKRRLTIEGGRLNLSLAGGIDVDNTSDDALTIRMKGGTVAGCVYGAAAFSSATGGRRFIFTGGTVGGWIAGGANGTHTTGGKLEGKTFIYFGGTAQCNSNGSATTIGPGNATGGNIFGAGSGNASASSTATVGEVDQSTIVIADESMVERNVFGGGNYGYVAGSNADNKSDIYILGGDVKESVYGGANMQKGSYVNIIMNGGLVEGGVYGGSNSTGTIYGNVTMHINGGQVGTPSQHANVHGGGYGNATRVYGNVELTVGSSCNATSGVTVYGDVYGGSAEGLVNANSYQTEYSTTVKLYKGTIYGGLYGGGLGSATYAANVNGPVYVQVFGGSVLTNDGTGENGSGGVFGCNNTNGTPTGTVQVDIYGTDPAPDPDSYALYAVYGGGNRSHYTGVPVVTIHGCSNSIEYVYGGGNASDVRGTNVTIWGGHIGNAFGGGNGFGASNPGANITAEGTNLTIHGGKIEAAFGGSNQKGYINSTITVTVEEQDESGTDPCSRAYTSCDKLIVELYGGGNEAPIKTSSNLYISPDVKINSCDMEINNLFGGAKAADYGGDINLVVTKGKFQNVFAGNNQGGTIKGNVTLTLKGGTMENAFGGCNESGDITGTISVVVDSTGNDCVLKVDNVYGGGKDAAYKPTSPTGNTPTVDVVNGTVRNAVFGGGLGATAKVTASPKVTIGSTGAKPAFVGGKKIDGTPGVGNVYGGGSAADVVKSGANTGDTHVILQNKAEIKGNVYGGGNEAAVEGDTKVELK